MALLPVAELPPVAPSKLANETLEASEEAAEEAAQMVDGDARPDTPPAA
jgi:hypothetical protein